MALIVEDGTGKANSESYAATTDADTYWTNRADTQWAALSTANKEAALRIATDYMVQTYRMKWRGRRVLNTQALDWPRVGVVLDEAYTPYPGVYGYFQISYQIVPPEIKSACIELAYRWAVTYAMARLLDDLQPQVQSESVGGISVDYIPGARQTIKYEAVERLLGPFISGPAAANNLRMQRS